MVERYDSVLIVPEGCSMKARSSGRGAETGSEVTKHPNVRVEVFAACHPVRVVITAGHPNVRVVAIAAGLGDCVVAGPVPVVSIAVKRGEVRIVVNFTQLTWKQD